MITASGGCGAIVAALRPSASPKTSAASVNTEILRSQLDQLHAEAETTRTKANTARLRLLRLSEAAENLRRQAVVNVKKGKENDARDLLFQKKKVMEALEKSKGRIELLDQLSSKLNEAISIKETQLIGNIAVDLEVSGGDDSGPVRIVSPSPELSIDSDEDTQNLQTYPDFGSPEEEERRNDRIEGEARNSKEVSSYETFLEDIDLQLDRIEGEIVKVLNVSALVLSLKEKPKNLKVQQMMELLDGIRALRQRIAEIIDTEAKTA